jgi:cyclic beta-1,2-glucan glucanotransferase
VLADHRRIVVPKLLRWARPSSRGQPRTSKSPDIVTGPIRGELLGTERLAERARLLAREQRVATPDRRRRAPLLERLDDTREILADAHARLAAAAERDVAIGPAAEWFLDNYHVIAEHLREVRESLPRGYYRELPKLAGGPLAGYPRVYEIAITLISHTEARVDLETVELLVRAYQEVRTLSIGELWALPAMLRLGLIESVRRMALRTVQRLAEVEEADRWSERIRAVGENGRGELTTVLNDLIASPPPLTPTFVSRFVQQLRANDSPFTPLAWIEQWIAEDAMSVEDAAAQASRRLAQTQIAMANGITSLRAVARMDWRNFVERTSAMDAVLREDPAGCYQRMTFATRDRYRHVVERIAKRTGLDEAAVAERVVALAAPATDPRRHHVGYFLVDEGLPELERAVDYRPTFGERIDRWVHGHPNIVFVGGIVLVTIGVLAAVIALSGPGHIVATLVALAIALIPATEVAVNAVNQLITAFLPPRTLPALDFHGAYARSGVSPSQKTAVVVPTLLGSVAAVEDALEHLEIQFLANRDENIHFALLSDFTDADAETMPTDARILAAAVDGIAALEARYGRGIFFLFHRPRRWNPRQGVWMGWERKRGKLAEFNRFLRSLNGAPSGFSTVVGEASALRGVRYVITLDSDTVLPPGGAALLVGMMAHPLNRAEYDAASGRVVRGYGIIQPRVGISLPSAYRSRFAAIHSGHPGVDPYTTAVSDVYQDLYGEGSFTGKGIYDVDAFEEATRGRFPENTLLSHDLIEGNYARAGLATDIEVYDDYPTRYLTFARRKHRWIRGDWQLLGWLRSRVPGPDGPERNRLSVLSRWKIFDNLRRSTVEIAQLALLVAGWTLLPGSTLQWTVLVLMAVAAPWVISLILAVVRPPLDKSWRAYYAAVGRDLATAVQQFALAVTFLPHQAWISADAIARTLWRLVVSKRSLLEWQTASQTERIASGRAADTLRRMWPALAFALAVLAVAASVVATRSAMTGFQQWELALATLPLAMVWAASPAIAHALNAPAVPRERRVPAARQAAAMRYAVLHWRFFERFVGPETHWLAPDNFQENPVPIVAMRTSPTNIGLQLLSTVSACDLGIITVARTVERLEGAFRALERMRRSRGHFYNWYDLHDLHVLEPAYISTVDSGNLAGHLLALRQACLTIPDAPVFDARAWLPIEAALVITIERLQAAAAADSTWRPALATAMQRVRTAHAAAQRPDRAVTPDTVLDDVLAALREVRPALGTAAARPAAEQADIIEALAWVEQRIAERRRTLDGLTPTPATGRGGAPTVVYPTLRALAETSPDAAGLIARLEAIGDRAAAYAMEMDFRFLFDRERKLFTIGYREDAHARDPSYYDLLASEARLASFVAIAKNDVPAEHWFRLGRTLTHAARETALVSWSGSMFEYLMPMLVMRSLPFTLLDQTHWAAVRRQISYGSARDVPWGVSESAYNLRDRHRTYQYRAFGVPDLALKRGLGRDLVVAPYASALAALVAPRRALANLATLERIGMLGPYGFRDAIDYTRPSPGMTFGIVGTYMAHHIGMSLIALTNALTDQVWQRRFHADAMVKAAELLLYERIPRRLVLQDPQTSEADEALPNPDLERPAVREIDTPDTPQPHVALLGHLPYTIMVSHAGAGYSRFEGLAVTRWRADGTRDNTGQFIYLRDAATSRAWSAAHQPMCAPADWYQARLATDRVTFVRIDGDIETQTEIAVVPEDAAEVRRVTVTNNGDDVREIDVTSYGEIVLAPPDADRAHPAFSNLFVQTEWHAWCEAITATRRPRAATERSLWTVHVVTASPERVGPATCETDRARFIGRGRSTRDPIVLDGDGPLSMTAGAVLDPIFAIRVRLRLEPRQSGSVAFTTLVASSAERAFALADRYHDARAAQRALDLAWTAAQVELRELGISPAGAAVYQELAGHLFYANPGLRCGRDEILRNRHGQTQLWSQGISGDWPILLATIDDIDGLPTLRQLLSAHQYWRRRAMMVDLVVLNAHPPTYDQHLNDAITATIYASSEATMIDQPGGIFLRRRDLLDENDLLMLRATARVHVLCDGRPLTRILAGIGVDETHPADARGAEPDDATPLRPSGRSTPPALRVVRRLLTSALGDGPEAPAHATTAAPPPRHAEPIAGDPLLLDNGFGGLTPEGDYEIRIAGAHLPPAPWANVIANPRAGFVVTERGGGFTWTENSHFYRLTPWHNDPVSDPAGEALFLRDAESGTLWSATPAPAGDGEPYVIRHGAAWSTFTHQRDGIESHLLLGVPAADPVKLSILRLTNRSDRPRRLLVTSYVEWTLGVQREHTQHQVHTHYDATLGAMLAWNTFDAQFADLVAVSALSEAPTSHTGDRREVIGRNGTLANPVGLRQPKLADVCGAGFDPCAALQATIALAPGETREIVAVLGAGRGEDEARRLAEHYRDPRRAADAIEANVLTWADRLDVVRVRTPEPSFDAMVNRWALYQAFACRMWARSALYQSSGAYGFRDQLQDTMAFVYAEPGVARAHILRAAARQFVEGDVQHWWHPQSGRGVRTRFSDDLAWLPFVVDQYVAVTGDSSIFDEEVPFITMRPLAPHEHEVYDLPQIADERASIYEHCVRALRKACTQGPHGLPLIGIGDWNDGMNRVGVEGHGESVWLAWFLIATLRAFAPCSAARGDTALAGEWKAIADRYAKAVEEAGWDGAWYRRAYFDDGTPLGSATNDECRIDAIAQSWSVISGAGNPERQAQAMRSFAEHLVREDARLLMLLTPPFDKTAHDPGYIKGYLPGVRENGAQYTHAALWSVLATAMRGDGDEAFRLFQMINPLTHARTPEEAETYKVEPYVVAADVYTAPGHLGRGGWTWYTGSASWMYRVALEAILGFTKRGDTLTIDPRVPSEWAEYTIEHRVGRSAYAITVRMPGRIHQQGARVRVDGTIVRDGIIRLIDDGRRHEVVVEPR